MFVHVLKNDLNAVSPKFPVKISLLFLFLTALNLSAQTNLVAPTNSAGLETNTPAQKVLAETEEGLALAQRVEEMRAVCIENRRRICGKIIKVLPDGLVVDSGYTNLMRAPLNGSWLIPGTAEATRATHLVEGKQPDDICIGLVFITDVPRTPGAKPKAFDYVNLEGFPMGQYTYTSVGDLQRTVRRFTTKVANSVRWNFEEQANASAPPK